MSAILFYLSRDREIYRRLASEIRTAFSSGHNIHGGPQLASCKYLRAVINETLRMSPSSIGTLWRQQDLALPSQVGKPFFVDGHVIPPGTMVGLSPYSLLHNEKYFPGPFVFQPERHLHGEKGSEGNDMRAFAPFSVGSRSCGGRAVAYLEASLAVAKTLWYFDFERAPGEVGNLGEGGPGLGKGRERKNEFQVYDVVTAQHKGPNLVFKPRGQYWKELAEKVPPS
jgi:cytochrome P450